MLASGRAVQAMPERGAVVASVWECSCSDAESKLLGGWWCSLPFTAGSR